MIKLSNTFKNKKKLIIVVGAGGTGGWLIPLLSKIDNQSIIIDGDYVESKNIKRQNFFNSDVNSIKSEVLGERYHLMSVNQYLNSVEMLEELFKIDNTAIPMVVGCVDNNASRKIIHDTFMKRENMIWIDSGNTERTGQIYIAIKEDGEVKYPSPIDIDTVLAKLDKNERHPEEISCAEVSLSAPQNITTNATAAVMLFNTINLLNHTKIMLYNKLEWDTRLMTFQTKEVFNKGE